MNRLYFGDNLKWISDRKEFPDISVDLIYLDPPFNTNYNVTVPFLLFFGDDYLNETSSILKVVDNEKSVVQRNCNRIV